MKKILILGILCGTYAHQANSADCNQEVSCYYCNSTTSTYLGSLGLVPFNNNSDGQCVTPPVIPPDTDGWQRLNRACNRVYYQTCEVEGTDCLADIDPSQQNRSCDDSKKKSKSKK